MKKDVGKMTLTIPVHLFHLRFLVGRDQNKYHAGHCDKEDLILYLIVLVLQCIFIYLKCPKSCMLHGRKSVEAHLVTAWLTSIAFEATL